MYSSDSPDAPPMSLRFSIDHDMDSAELSRRDAYEHMFRRAPDRLLSMNAIDAVMDAKNFFCIWTHLDATVEYAIDNSSDETAIYFQRDWTKSGLLRAPYRMCISEPGVGKFYYRVRSVMQLRRALAHWEVTRDRVDGRKLLKKE